MMGANFFAVPRSSATTSAGTVELPILYHRVEALYAYWWVGPDAAAAVLPDLDLVPLRFFGNRALAAVAFFVYHDTSIGPYQEVGSALAVVPRTAPPVVGGLDLARGSTKRRAGFYILDLPVSTDIANAAGRELWGYPKFVTDLSFRVEGRDVQCAVADPGGGDPLLTLEGTIGGGVPLPALDLVLYSRRGDAYLRAVVDTRGSMRTSCGSGLRLQCKDSTYALGQRLRDLGLTKAHPTFVQYGDAVQTRLNAGVVVGAGYV
jgi:hypothetical protein